MEAHSSSWQTMTKRIRDPSRLPCSACCWPLPAPTRPSGCRSTATTCRPTGCARSWSSSARASALRSGVAGTFRVKVGKQTQECVYRSPVIGRDLEHRHQREASQRHARLDRLAHLHLRGAARTATAASSSFRSSRRRAPTSWSATYRRTARRPWSHRTRAPRIKGLNLANKLRLRASNTDQQRLPRHCLRQRQEAGGVHRPCLQRPLRPLSTFSVGSTKAANGALASFDDLQVSLPDPNG